MLQPFGWIDIFYWAVIAVVSIGWWRSASRNRVGEREADPSRTRIEDAAGRVS